MNNDELKISFEDYSFLEELCAREYTSNSMLSNASNTEHNRYLEIQYTLKRISRLFWEDFFDSDNSLKCDGSSRNPINRAGNLKWPWSCVYRGSNKQFGAQISIIFEPKQKCMKVGFFFGEASCRNMKKADIEKELKNMERMAQNLKNNIKSNYELSEQFLILENLGFVFYSNGNKQDPMSWLSSVVKNPVGAHITAPITLSEHNVITVDTFKNYYYQIGFLLSIIDSNIIPKRRKYHISIETRKRQLDMFDRIGKKGEEYIMQVEREKLERMNVFEKYPMQVSLDDDSCGYDILSLDENRKEIFIEVKSTVLQKRSKESNLFYMTENEWKTYEEKGKQYILLRVYDVDGAISHEPVNLENVKKRPKEYVVEF